MGYLFTAFWETSESECPFGTGCFSVILIQNNQYVTLIYSVPACPESQQGHCYQSTTEFWKNCKGWTWS